MFKPYYLPVWGCMCCNCAGRPLLNGEKQTPHAHAAAHLPPLKHRLQDALCLVV